MIRFLLQRPIGVIMSFLAAIIFSILALVRIPVSLLPEIEVPEIIIRVNYPGHSAAEIEEKAIRPIREQLSSLNGIQQLDSKSGTDAGSVRLRFDFGISMNLAYIEINEKIDRLAARFPTDLPRPDVVRISTADIPVLRMQIVPPTDFSFTQLSELCDKTLKKRLEQLEGISLVDINGLQFDQISLRPQTAAMQALGITEQVLIQSIQQNNVELGAIHLNDGAFRYFLKLKATLTDLASIKNLVIKKIGTRLVYLHELAEVRLEELPANGYHLSNGQRAIVLKIHKQGAAQMNQLMPKIKAAVEQFELEYPQLAFDLSQDQTALLNVGISNLQTSLLLGGAFAFAVLFVFLGDLRTPLIIGLSLPTSFIISFLFLYAFNISLNIISLSGLALGLGMLIDNAIIVLENIKRHLSTGLSGIDAAVKGVSEVMGALISSVLTTLAVFIPLIFLSGVSGALFYDQAISVSVILGVSLLVAFILLPLLFVLFYKSNKVDNSTTKETRIFSWIVRVYDQLFNWFWARKAWAIVIILLPIPLALWALLSMKTEGVPPISKNDMVLEIHWNEPITLLENRSRMKQLTSNIAQLDFSEADVGISQFLLPDGPEDLQVSRAYLRFNEAKNLLDFKSEFIKSMLSKYPLAKVQLEPAPNAFDQLFSSSQPFVQARIRAIKSTEQIPFEKLQSWYLSLPDNLSNWQAADGLQQQTQLQLVLDVERMNIYGVSATELHSVLSRLLSNTLVTNIKGFGEQTPIYLINDQQEGNSKLNENFVSGANQTPIRINELVRLEPVENYKNILADRSGIYHDLQIDGAVKKPAANIQMLDKQVKQQGWLVGFTGQYFDNQKTLKELIFIILISTALLYFILAAQFESFLQPLIVLLTLPLGMAGSVLVLFIAGSSLNIMALIGVVVMLGVMVNDAILKVDSINQLRQKQPNQDLDNIIHTVGLIRLKPILMTSVTTILALLPVSFTSGLGAELQRSLVLSVMGGLTIGTFTAIYFIPICYKFLVK